jgi:hypothetical protein
MPLFAEGPHSSPIVACGRLTLASFSGPVNNAIGAARHAAHVEAKRTSAECVPQPRPDYLHSKPAPFMSGIQFPDFLARHLARPSIRHHRPAHQADMNSQWLRQ